MSFGGRIPTQAGRKLVALSTMAAGTTPAAMILRAPYMSPTNAFSARTRCTRPRSIVRHSEADTTRGRMSNGMIFSTPALLP